MIGPDDVTLIDLLVDGFEKNEVWNGFHHRELPMRDAQTAALKFAALAEEARRWKGEPTQFHETTARRIAVWDQLEIRQANRGVMVRVRAPGFSKWWHEEVTWDGDVMGKIMEWLEEDGGKVEVEGRKGSPHT